MLRLILMIVGVAALLGWIAFYIWASAMACAFGSPNSNTCDFTMPWEMHGEDLTIFVLIPGGIVVVIFLAAWWAGRAAQSK